MGEPLPRPMPPALVEKLDRLSALRAQVAALELEIAQDQLKAARADSACFERLQATLAARKADQGPRPAICKPGNKKESKPRASWMNLVFHD